MKSTKRSILLGVVLSASAIALAFANTAKNTQEVRINHVRWDILHFDPTTTPPTISAGGVAFASARNPSSLSIKVTGSGTFTPDDPEEVTGGGTWETFSGTTSTGSGTYEVTGLVSFEFSNFQTATFNDQIDDGTRANGVAVLRIRYSDGSTGVLNVGCHGAGAPEGTLEGTIESKGHVTYWDGQAPMGGVDANRTVFHVMNSTD